MRKGVLMQAKPLTESSFILMTDAGDRFGLLLKKDLGVELITSDTQNEFPNLESLEDLLGGSIHFIKPIENKGQSDIDINGYPCRHVEIFDIEKGELITYKASPNSSVRWIAGWWGIRFTRGFITFLCPKPGSLEGNDFVGPFKTKMEAEASVKIKNQQIRDDDESI